MISMMLGHTGLGEGHMTSGQRTLYNFQITDPFAAPTFEKFREQYRSLHGRNPSAKDLSRFYEAHPEELSRRRASGK